MINIIFWKTSFKMHFFSASRLVHGKKAVLVSGDQGSLEQVLSHGEKEHTGQGASRCFWSASSQAHCLGVRTPGENWLEYLQHAPFHRECVSNCFPGSFPECCTHPWFAQVRQPKLTYSSVLALSPNLLHEVRPPRLVVERVWGMSARRQRMGWSCWMCCCSLHYVTKRPDNN